MIFLSIYLVSIVFCFTAGWFLINQAYNKSRDFLMKHMILGIIATIFLGLFPVINTIGLFMIIFGGAMAVFEDDDSDHWWNNPANPRNK